jgi:hypothetical protein
MRANAIVASKMDPREERGRRIARTARIKQVGSNFVVPSQSENAESKQYIVDLVEQKCTCPDYEQRHSLCKHYHAVLYWIAAERHVASDGTVTDSVTIKRKTYPQKDWSAYNASQAHEKEYIERLLRALCTGIKDPPRKPGPGAPPIALADKVFAATMKVYTQQTARAMETDLRRSAERGDIDDAPSCGSIWSFFQKEETTPLLVSLVEQSAAPVAMIEAGQYAIDSSGVATTYYDRWFSHKHGKVKSQRPWVKLHVMCGTVTHAITGVKVSPEGDCPQLPELVAATRKHHSVREVSADKAYSSKNNLETLEAWGIEPFIPFKDNAVVDLKSEAWSHHLVTFRFNQERFLPHYHRRSNAETCFAMMKRFGSSVRSRTPTAQINETLAICLAHNAVCLTRAIFMAGLVPVFWKGEPSPTPPPTTLTLVKP